MLRMPSPLANSLLLSFIAAGSVWLGCATRTTLVGRPAPMPVPNEAVVNDLKRLVYSGCLSEGDPFTNYIFELENYRVYICKLRGAETLEQCVGQE